MERVKTGIVGLDEMLNGGIPAGHQVFLCGGPGTGKTTLGLEFLYRGAKMGERGLFLSLEEEPDSILRNVQAVCTEWKDFASLVSERKIVVAGQEAYIHLEKGTMGAGGGMQYAVSRVMSSLDALISENDIKRITIDSSTIIKMFFESGIEYRRTLMNMLKNMKKKGCTTLVTGEFPTLERGELHFENEHFVADGIIMLYNLQQQEKRLPAIEVVKMRSTVHSKSLTPIKITSGGISVYVGEKVY